MELEQTKGEFISRGLRVAAVTHDNVAILDHFAKRKGISFPMLADADAVFARALDIVNTNVPKDNAVYGIPFPGTYILDENGVVQAKFFEPDHRERYSASSILVKHFRDAAGAASTSVDTKHLRLTYSASDSVVRPGNMIALSLQVDLKPGMHVYAPGVEGGYKPIHWEIPASDVWIAVPAMYPESKTLHLDAINETVPVYDSDFTITRDLTIGPSKALNPYLESGELKVEGVFRYQACNERMCFPPESILLTWTFQAEGHDTQRAPEELRTK